MIDYRTIIYFEIIKKKIDGMQINNLTSLTNMNLNEFEIGCAK